MPVPKGYTLDGQATGVPAGYTVDAPPPPDFSANPNGEGVYKMAGPGGAVGVPFSNVLHAQRAGYKLDAGDAPRFNKDYIGQPARFPDAGKSQGLGDVLRGMGQEIAGTVKGVGGLFAPGQNAAETGVGAMSPGALALYRMGKGVLGNERTAAAQTMQYAQDAASIPFKADPVGKMLTGARAGVSALSMLNPLNPAGTAGLNTAIDQGKSGEALGAGLVDSALIAGPEALGKIGVGAKGMLRGDVDAPMAGSTITPRMRYEAAQRLGVQMDAADATGSGPLGILKKINRDSLVGSPVYDAAASRNVAAVRGGTDKLLSDMSPLEPAQGGKLIQDKLKANQSGLRDAADTQFRQLDDATGGAPVPGAGSVGQAARKILEAETPFYDKYPTFKPGTAVSALQDLSKVGDTSSYGDLQRLRSNTHELTTANPDLVKDQGTSWLQQMTGTLDDAITDKGLSPAQTNIFRDANAKWADMKGQYDDPSSPLYSAVRTPNPSKLSSGIGGKSPEMLENVKPRIGEEGVGAMQRGVTTDLLKNTADGDYDFRGFGRRLYALPDSYRKGLFGEAMGGRLDDVARTTHAIGTDFNPSGSAKQLQKVGEGGTLLSTFAGHPLGLAPLLQYPLAKMMNAPGMVRWLMKDGASAVPGVKGPFSSPSDEGAGATPTGSAPQPPSPPPMVRPVPRSMAEFGTDLPLGKIGKPAAVSVAEARQDLSHLTRRLPGLDGMTTELHTPAGTQPATYRVLEADALTSSHNATNFRPNPDYPAGVQERDYAGNRENQLRVIQNAQDYKPALTITDNPDAINGPPVVTPNGTVLGGNSRVMSTQRHYGEGGTAYKEYLKAQAAHFGMDAGDIDQMHAPVLVREVAGDGGADKLRELGSLLNKPLTGSMSAAERAVSMGKAVSPETLHAVRGLLNQVGDGATLRDVMSDPARSNALLQRMQQDGIVGREERPEFVDTATGGMNEDGKRLVEKALMGTVLGDASLMQSAPKNVMAKLNASIGPLAEVGSRADEWNILPSLRKAIEVHRTMAAAGMGVEDFLNQHNMFRDQLTPLDEHMVRVLGQNQNAVRDGFSAYGKDSEYARPGQATFLGSSAHESFNHAFHGNLSAQDFGGR